MTTYIIHRGTDTWIDLDDSVVYLNTENVEGDITDDNSAEVIDTHGVPVNAYNLDPEVNIGNSINFGAGSIATEIAEGLPGLPDDVREWATDLPTDVLAEIGQVAILDERLWDAFSAAIIDTLTEYHGRATA